MRKIDSVDAKILEILQSNSRTANSEIARIVGLAPSAITERIKRLERDKILLGYGARVAPGAVDAGLLAFVAVRGDERPGDSSTADRLAAVPGVLEVHHVAGEDCYLVKIRTSSPAALGRLLRRDIGAIESVVGTRSTVVLETVLEKTHLTIPVKD